MRRWLPEKQEDTKRLASGHQPQNATAVPLWQHTEVLGQGWIPSIPSGPAPDLPGTPPGMPRCFSEELSRFLLEVESEQDKGPSARALQPDQINTQLLDRGLRFLFEEGQGRASPIAV